MVYSAFIDPVIDAAGQIAFRGALTGPGVNASNNSGIWSEAAGTPGSQGLIARTGDVAPGTGPGTGVVYSSFNLPVISAAGQTAYLGVLTGTGVTFSNDRGIWSEAAGTLGSPGLVAREGNHAPGTAPGVVYNGLGEPVIDAAGQTAFRDFLTGGGVTGSNDTGIWSEAAGTPGSPGLVAREADAAPGTGTGVVYSGFNNPVINAAGQTAFRAFLAGNGVDASNNSGIWSEAAGTPGSPGLVVRQTDAAPGTGTNVVYIAFNDPVLNAAGQTAFFAFITGSGVTDSNNSGIWFEPAGTLGSPRLVAREGDAAPGTDTGVVYSDFVFDPVINAAGQTAFRGGLTGTGVNGSNDSGIWSEAAGTLGSPGLVAREGDAAPGTGAVYSQFDDPVINAAGQTAFLAFLLTGNGVTFSNNAGLWATDPDGLLTLIARTGDLFDVNDDPFTDDFRTISSVSFFANSSGEDGRATSFNDAGQLAFFLSFTDGSQGLFVASVPEPAGLAVLGLGGVALLLRRRVVA